MAGLTIVCVTHDQETVNKNLLASPCLANPGIQCLVLTGYPNVAAAYNAAVLHAEHDLLCFVQPEVVLPAGWDEAIVAQAARVSEIDPDWAVLGVLGAARRGDEKHYLGHLREGGAEVGSAEGLPAEVDALDDTLLVCRQGDASFDEWMPNPSLLGTELCLRMRQEGRRCYAVDAYLHCNAPADANRLPLDYLVSCGYLYARYSEMLPILAPRVTIQRLNGVCVLTA